jgi:hypothetical protein
MSSKVNKLAAVYKQHLDVPWQEGVAGIQRVIFAVYDKTDELRLRANLDEFQLVTQQANKKWLLIDVTQAFPDWMAKQEYRDAYFESPEDLAGYQSGELTQFVSDLIDLLKEQVVQESDHNTVVALAGVGSLFGLARVSTVVEGIKDVIKGRLLVFFPGEHHPDSHTYRLLDARDGWNYLAIPLTANESI